MKGRGEEVIFARNLCYQLKILNLFREHAVWLFIHVRIRSNS